MTRVLVILSTGFGAGAAVAPVLALPAGAFVAALIVQLYLEHGDRRENELKEAIEEANASAESFHQAFERYDTRLCELEADMNKVGMREALTPRAFGSRRLAGRVKSVGEEQG